MKTASFITTVLLSLGLATVAAPANAMGLSDNDSGVYGSQIQLYGDTTIGAITARVSRGINPTGTDGSLGAFSEFTQISPDVLTLDFNQAGAKVGDHSYTFGNDSVVYSWQLGGRTNILNDRWAPSGAYGEVNRSDYLGVFRGRDVTISLENDLNYFGVDWGALSGGNDFAFYRDDQLLSQFTYADINPAAPVSASQHGGQGNAYVHFYANEASGTFNRIVLSQSASGGFESDNHSFRFSQSAFDFETGQDFSPETGGPAASEDVPFEVESTLGLMLLAMGWAGRRLMLKSKRQALA